MTSVGPPTPSVVHLSLQELCLLFLSHSLFLAFWDTNCMFVRPSLCVLNICYYLPISFFHMPFNIHIFSLEVQGLDFCYVLSTVKLI